MKDSYSFDFLEMSEEYNEREMELTLIKNVRKFLLEMGGDFAFMGNQYRLQVGKEDFFIDLLLYHRRLNSLVAVELKTTRFKSEYASKMQFYLTALNEQVKTEGKNAAIGIIICKEKDRTVVEYALKDMNSPMGVATYNIREELPEKHESTIAIGRRYRQKFGKTHFIAPIFGIWSSLYSSHARPSQKAFGVSFSIRDTVRPELSWSHYRLLMRVEKKISDSFI